MKPEKPIDDVIIEEETKDTTDSVTVENDQPNPTGGEVVAEMQSEEVELEDKKPERDDYYKNKAYEYERKLNRLTEDLPSLIENAIASSAQKNESTKQQYSIEELIAFKHQNPEYAAWADIEIEKKRQETWEKKLTEQQELATKKQREEALRAESQNKVLSDPRFAEAFVTGPDGVKRFNDRSPLAHAIHSYMQDPALKNRPDALLIASKLAYADNTMSGKSEQKVDKLKRKNAQLKTQTLVEGGGVPYEQPKVDEYQAARQRLIETGRKDAAIDAIKAYMKKTRG